MYGGEVTWIVEYLPTVAALQDKKPPKTCKLDRVVNENYVDFNKIINSIYIGQNLSLDTAP